jgi:hypothetical protein
MSEPSRSIPNPESGGSAPPQGGIRVGGAPRDGSERPQNVADAITDIADRLTALVHDEIDLAKAEVSAKVTRLLRGAIVAGAAGIFIVTGVVLVLEGFAWLLYYELPLGNQFTFFWGFFAMAVILFLVGGGVGLGAYRVLRASSPPVPEIAIEEARKIRETVEAGAHVGADGKEVSGVTTDRGDS